MGLKAFINCKANDGSCFLIDYLVEEIYKVDPELMEFAQEMYDNLVNIRKYDVTELYQEVNQKLGVFSKMMTQVELSSRSVPPDEGFVTFFHKFLAENNEKIVALDQDTL